MIEVSSLYLELIYQQMLKDIRSCAIINCDETTLQCLEERANGRTSSSYAWLVMSNQYEEKQLAIYYYDATREHQVLSKIIGHDYHIPEPTGKPDVFHMPADKYSMR